MRCDPHEHLACGPRRSFADRYGSEVSIDIGFTSAHSNHTLTTDATIFLSVFDILRGAAKRIPNRPHSYEREQSKSSRRFDASRLLHRARNDSKVSRNDIEMSPPVDFVSYSVDFVSRPVDICAGCRIDGNRRNPQCGFEMRDTHPCFAIKKTTFGASKTGKTPEKPVLERPQL